MRAIIVDDEAYMQRKFLRLTEDLQDLQVIGSFHYPLEAIQFAKQNAFEIAFLDVEMPKISGVQLAGELRKIHKEIIIVFITAYDEYIRDANNIGADYYIVKPYTKETLQLMMEKLRLLTARQKKTIEIQMFGRFTVKKDGKQIGLSGKAKEILAYVAMKRGREVSNEELFSVIWEGKPYSNANMSTYYNAVRRLRHVLQKAEADDLLISTKNGKAINTELISCDYYDWKDQNIDKMNQFEGEFLIEYSWGEYFIQELTQMNITN